MKFVDTSWWAAWALASDRRHSDTCTMLKRLRDGETMLTTNLVLHETWTLIRAGRRGGHAAAVKVRDSIKQLAADGSLVVHTVTPEEEEAAWEWLYKHDERVYSFVDAASFVVMWDQGILEALAFDEDFAANFTVVQP